MFIIILRPQLPLLFTFTFSVFSRFLHKLGSVLPPKQNPRPFHLYVVFFFYTDTFVCFHRPVGPGYLLTRLMKGFLQHTCVDVYISGCYLAYPKVASSYFKNYAIFCHPDVFVSVKKSP